MASVPVFITWVTAQVVTAAQMNSNIRDAGNFFLSWPVLEARQTVAQSIPNAAGTAVLLDTEDIDTDNMHSTVTNTSRATAVTAGRYRVSGSTSAAANATGRRGAILAVNGTAIVAGEVDYQAVTNAQPTVVAGRSRTIFLNVGDYVEVWAFQESGGAMNTAVSVNTWQPGLSVHWVGTT